MRVTVSVCIGFTLSVIASDIINILSGNDLSGYGLWLLQLLGYLIITQFVDSVLSKIDFKTSSLYYISDFAILYVTFMIIAYCFNWFGFRVGNIILITIIFACIYVYMCYYFYRLRSQEAEKINEILARKQINKEDR